MADTYISIPLETDPEDVLNDAYTVMQALVPGWQPASGNLDVWILMAIASQAAESRDVASDVSRSIFRWYGANLVNIPPVDASAAYGNTTWTLTDTLGHTIPAGTQVALVDVNGNVIPFETVADVTVFPGSSVTAAGAVAIVAIDTGTAANGLTNPVSLLDPLIYVSSITITAPTSGGQNAESDDDYLNRLAAQLELLAPRPIIPNDFAVFARNITGVWRSVAIDLYKADTATPNVPRCVTVVSIDQAGVPVSAAVKTAIDVDLQARREVNFLVYEADATTTLIDVTYAAIALAGYEVIALRASINAEINSYLDPATWGTTEQDGRAWRLITKVRYLEIAQVINDTPGVDYISSLTIGIHGGSMGTADIDLPGIAPLPDASTITGTVT